jgi:hypothetical protein
VVARVSRRGRGDRPRLGALPIVLIIAFLLVGTLATTLSIPPASPSPSGLPAGSLPPFSDATAPPTQTPSGRYPPDAEANLVNSCVSGIDPNTVPGPIAAAFCVCTLNRFEQTYPTYDEFQRATASGAFTDQMKTAISNACAVQIVGG